MKLASIPVLHHLTAWRSSARAFVLAMATVWAATLTTSCTKLEETTFPDKLEPRPVMLFTDTTLLDFYDGPHLMWKLKTARLERWGGSDRIFVRPILVDIYDSTGKRIAFLRADSGSLDGRLSFLNAQGHVFAFTPGGASVRSDSLTWNKRENVVRTQSRVRVVTEDGDVLMGRGFVSDARLHDWQIQRDVTAIFQDAANRAREADSSDAELSRVGPAQAPQPVQDSAPVKVPPGSNGKVAPVRKGFLPGTKAPNKPPKRRATREIQ